MNTRSLLFILLFLLISTTVSAQINGFTDDFSNGSLDTLWNGSSKTLWNTNSDNTFSLSEGNGVFSINYSRNNESTDNDFFRFTAPEKIDVSETPKIRFSIRSTISSTLLLRSIFGSRGGANQDATYSIIGDNQWRTISMELDPDIFGNLDFNYLYFYLDQNTNTLRSGTFEIDDLKIAGFSIKIPTIQAEVVDGNSVALSWTSSDPDGTKSYTVHRNSDPDFTPGTANLVWQTEETNFTNVGLDFYQTYFYKVVPIDTLDDAYSPSRAVMAQTYEAGTIPTVTVSQINLTEVPTYEKLALDLELANTTIYNPFDPDDIDVFAHFMSPDGRKFRINAFYDNYNSANQWRLYFAPDLVGEWSYKLFINDVSGSDSTETATFTAVESDHHGPLKVSEDNADYLVYHDGTPFYGLAVYYPWSVQENSLDRLKEHGLNMIGYWNSTYDGGGNGGGYRLFESLQSGLGRYDQQKIGRIEQILGWLEERDMMMMYAIWAHPFLRDGAPSWDPIHFSYNPYKDIVNATEFYTDSLAWEYQLKNYRYLIARFGHHRSMGIWEIINEQHGTTGFVNDQGAALDWLNKVDAYLKEHDPYRRPTTASVGSVELWSQRDIHADIANRHYYELQGYPRPFNDDIHDGLFNIVEAFQGLKRSGKRPAMLGEAGATHMFSTSGSNGYDTELHNAFWAGLATGMASTPFWWDYTTSSIFTEEVMDTYLHLKAFVDELPLSHTNYTPVEIDHDEAYIYSMQNDTSAFGWLWKISSENIPGVKFPVDNLETGSYQLTWFNTWNGEAERIDTVVSVGEILPLTVPDMPVPERDIAFKLVKIGNGETATSLNILFPYDNVTVGEMPHAYPLFVYLTDASGLLVEDAVEVNFSSTGNGFFTDEKLSTTNGIVVNNYITDKNGPSEFSVTVTASGLESASLNNVFVTENEEAETQLPSSFSLQQNYPNPFNPSTVISYQLPMGSHVSLKVFDMLGREVANLVNGMQAGGSYQINFDASQLSSGMYIYRLEAGSFSETRRMMLIK